MRLVLLSLVFLVVIFNWLWFLPLPLIARLAMVLLIVLVAFYHQWCRLSSGSVFTPEMPRPLIIFFNWAFGALVILMVLQLAVDGGALIIALINWSPVHISTMARILVGVAAGLLSGWGVMNAVGVPAVREIIVSIPGMSPVFDGYSLVQLTDLHITRLFPTSWTKAVVEKTNKLKPDLIVVTGDFIDGSVDMRRHDVAPLSQLNAPDGVLAIPGNHEYFFEYGMWMQHLSGLGFRMLLNQHAIITRETAHLVVAGVTDRSAAHHGEQAPDLELALAGRPPLAPIILLDHQPGEARIAAEHGVALQLSGHTHGGMIWGLDRLVAKGNNGFVSGRYQLGKMTLYVSNGTGIWPGFALRLGRNPEITYLRLRAG